MSWYEQFKTSQPQPDADEIYKYFGDPKEWNVGNLAILSNTGFSNCSVVRVVEWDTITQRSDKYQKVNEDEIVAPNPFGSMNYKRGESVPVLVLKTYGSGFNQTGQHYAPGTIHIVGAQHLYRTIDALVDKESQLIYPEIIIKSWSSGVIGQISKEFPQLKLKNRSILDQIQYETFDINGTEVLVLQDPRALKNQQDLQRSGYPHPIGVYYWYIPSINVSSQSLENAMYHDKNPEVRQRLLTLVTPGMDRLKYKTVQDAANSAEKYLSFIE